MNALDTFYYRLEGKNPVPCHITELTSDRVHVGDDQIDGVRVSTVFLGVNHQYGNGPPLLFETMIFGGPFDQFQWRYSTWDEALEGHHMCCRYVRAMSGTLYMASWRLSNAWTELMELLREQFQGIWKRLKRGV